MRPVKVPQLDDVTKGRQGKLADTGSERRDTQSESRPNGRQGQPVTEAVSDPGSDAYDRQFKLQGKTCRNAGDRATTLDCRSGFVVFDTMDIPGCDEVIILSGRLWQRGRVRLYTYMFRMALSS